MCHFDRVLFLTDGEFPLGDIEGVKIPRIISMEQYSLFIIKELNRFIETDFVLLVQYDGFIIDPDSWSFEFQEYDYIGAKWPHRDNFNVGNGGFSLRSKRLLESLSSNNISINRDSLKNGEDNFICRLNRKVLENEYNIRFAPETVADKFSYEYVAPPSKTFGFHGLFNMWRYIGEEYLETFVNLLSPKTITSVHALKLGIIYHKMRKFEQSRIVYRKILHHWPDNTAVLMLLDLADKTAVPDIPL